MDSDINVVYIGLGSNLGDREINIAQAVGLLQQRVGKLIAHSSLYQTEPVGFNSSNLFLNSVCSLATKLSPIKILEITKEIEQTVGRTEKTIDFQYQDRTIDIDILFYGEEVYLDLNLVIPHPQLQNRLFVLDPISEICPTLIHPILNKTIEQLKSELENR